jgi:hypothetical protein
MNKSPRVSWGDLFSHDVFNNTVHYVAMLVYLIKMLQLNYRYAAMTCIKRPDNLIGQSKEYIKNEN